MQSIHTTGLEEDSSSISFQVMKKADMVTGKQASSWEAILVQELIIWATKMGEAEVSDFAGL